MKVQIPIMLKNEFNSEALRDIAKYFGSDVFRQVLSAITVDVLIFAKPQGLIELSPDIDFSALNNICSNQ
jgi:hypothetical protein